MPGVMANDGVSATDAEAPAKFVATFWMTLPRRASAGVPALGRRAYRTSSTYAALIEPFAVDRKWLGTT